MPPGPSLAQALERSIQRAAAPAPPVDDLGSATGKQCTVLGGTMRRRIAKRPRRGGSASVRKHGTKKSSSGQTTRTILGGRTSDVLARLEAALAKNAPEVLARLNPGASESAIRALKQAVGVELPESFCDFYRWRNGGSERLHWLNGSWWMDTKSVASMKRMMDGIIDDGHYSNFRNDEWWSKSWVGFADDGSGHYALVIDAHGSFGGTPGQVLSAGAREYDRIVLAKDFDSWLEYLVAVYARGQFEIEDGVYEFTDSGLLKRICRGYPKHFEPTEAAVESNEENLQRPTLGRWPKGIDLAAWWLVQAVQSSTKHSMIERRGKTVSIWSGIDAGELKLTKKTHRTEALARREHEAELRRKIKTGFSALRSSERTRPGDCLLVAHVGGDFVALAGDGRTLAYGTMADEARTARLFLLDALTGRRRLIHSAQAKPLAQLFVHMVDFDHEDRPIWMLDTATYRYDVRNGSMTRLSQMRKTLLNPHASRSSFDAARRRLLTFHENVALVLGRGDKPLFRLAIKRGKSEYRDAAISPSGKRVALVRASAKDDVPQDIEVHDVDKSRLLGRVPIPQDVRFIRRIGFSHDDEQLLLADYHSGLSAFDLKRGERIWQLAEAREWAWSPDGKGLAVNAGRAGVVLLAAADRRTVREFEDPAAKLYETEKLEFSRDGTRLLQVGGGLACLWRLA